MKMMERLVTNEVMVANRRDLTEVKDEVFAEMMDTFQHKFEWLQDVALSEHCFELIDINVHDVNIEKHSAYIKGEFSIIDDTFDYIGSDLSDDVLNELEYINLISFEGFVNKDDDNIYMMLIFDDAYTDDDDILSDIECFKSRLKEEVESFINSVIDSMIDDKLGF